MSDGLVWLLGLPVEAAAVRAHLASLGPVVEVPAEEEQGDHYTTVPSAGLELISLEGIINTVILYPASSSALPLGLALSMTQPEVRSLLGEPQMTRVAKDDRQLGRVAAGDRYDTPEFSVALDYEEETGRIRMAQLIRPSAVPRGPAGPPRSRRKQEIGTLAAGLALGAAGGATVGLGWAPPIVGVAVAAAAGIAVGFRMRHLRRRQHGG